MEKYEILEHIAQAIKLEKECYTAQKLIEFNERQRLKPKTPPILTQIKIPIGTAPQPVRPAMRETPLRKIYFKDLTDGIIESTFAVFLIPALVFGIFGSFHLEKTYHLPAVRCFFLIAILTIVIGFGAILAIRFAIKYRRNIKDQKSAQKAASKEYAANFAKYSSDMERHRVLQSQKELAARERDCRNRQSYEKSLKETEEHNLTVQAANVRLNQIQRPLIMMLAKLKSTLAGVYDLGYIYPKYRNIIAYASFHEYLSSERCGELTGKDGAYNIFETELRLDRIIYQLDAVTANLEQIQKNQYFLYCEISRANKNIERLTSCVSDCLEHTARTGAYITSEISQFNSAAHDMYGQFRQYAAKMENANREVLRYLEHAKRRDAR